MIEWHDRLTSTQEVAHQRAVDGAPHGSAVAARVQSAGRGTRGRTWHSPDGGLWLSVICRPAHAATAVAFSVRVGLAVARAIEAVAPAAAPVRLKWPNDLHLHGRKLAGVLCEARWQGDVPAWIVAGIGINVANPLPPDLADSAARLADVDPAADPVALAGPVAAAVALAGARGGPLDPGELEDFRRRDALAGRAMRHPVAGVADGIEPIGALRIRTPDGQVVRVTEAGVMPADA